MSKKILKRAEGIEGEKVLSRFSPSSLNIEDRTVKSVLTTKRKVYHSSWWSEPFYEVLSTDPKHIRTERLDNGIPLLDGHDWSGSVLKQLGIAKGYEVVGEEIETLLRFSKKPDAETVFQDVIDGILTTTSIGYRVFEYEDISPEDRQPGEPATFKAIDYEIFEISMVPIPADPGALLRSDKGESMPKKLKRTEEETEEQKKAKKAESENEEEEEASDASEGTSAGDEPEEETEEQKKAKKELEEDEERAEDEEEDEEGEERSLKILKMARKANLDLEKTEALIRSKDSVETISNKILSDMAARQGGAKMSKVIITNDERAITREGMKNAILLRSGSKAVKLCDNSKRFMNMKLSDMVRSYLGLGWDVGNNELAQRAFHSTSDFALILTDALSVSLAHEYAELAQTFEPLVNRGSLNDFRESHIVDYGTFPKLQLLGEGGEIKGGTLGEGKNKKQLRTYASLINITRQTIINDQLDVFSKLPKMAARAGRDLEADLVWSILTGNPTMGDGKTLFHADHGNIVAAGNIDLAKVSAAIEKMKTQKGIDGKPVTVIPEYIVAPVALEAAALQFINTNFMASKQSDTNPYATTFKGVITDQRLDASSKTKFYLAADKSKAALIDLDTLDGAGMQLNVKEVFGSGITYEALYDIGASPADHKGFCLIG